MKLFLIVSISNLIFQIRAAETQFSKQTAPVRVVIVLNVVVALSLAAIAVAWVAQ